MFVLVDNRGKMVENKPLSLFSTGNLCHRRLNLDYRCEIACADFTLRCRKECGMETSDEKSGLHYYIIKEHGLCIDR